MSAPLLSVRGLTVSVPGLGGSRVPVVENVNLTLHVGETLGLVGESGSGKTMTSLAIMGLLPAAARIESGSILLEGEELIGRSTEQLRRLRGRRMSMIMQDATSALDPSFTIESQLSDPFRIHRGLRGELLDAEIGRSLSRVQLEASPERRRQYPHQLSGGMRQRVMSAIALAGQPALLIADEPTTALDVTTQVQYLRLLQQLQRETGFALLFIAHDLLIVRHLCARITVMYAGEVVEEADPDGLFTTPQHPYTRALVDAIPSLTSDAEVRPIRGHAPGAGDERSPCRFAPRCSFARDVCWQQAPLLRSNDGRRCRCWGTDPVDGWIDPATMQVRA